MAKLNELSDYANIKQPTNSDVRLPLRQIVTRRFESETGIGNNVIALPWSVDQSNKSNFFLYINGILLNETDDYTFANLNGYNASSTIQLVLTPVAIMPIVALNLGVETEINPSLANIQAQINQMSIVGEVKSAFLTLAQFQAQAGANWILCDGSNVAGSAYNTLTGNVTVPDMRATVPRMKDNGAGLDSNGDLHLGTFEADQYLSHSHGVHPTYTDIYNAIRNVGAGATPQTTGNPTSGYNTQASGGGETQGKSTVINFFIRIN